MSRRESSSRRLERRSEREAQRPGGGTQQQRRQRPARPAGGRRRRFNWIPVLAAAGVGAILGLVIYVVLEANESAPTQSEARMAELDSDPNLPGVYFPPHPGPDGVINTGDERLHLGEDVVIPICTQGQIDANTISGADLCYTSNPPTSGPHGGRPASIKVLDNPAPKESLIHTMEHGAVIVWFNTTDQAVIDKLASIVNEAIDRRRFVTMSAYSEMEPETIAFTAWTRLDKFPVAEFEEKRLEDFIEEHQRRFNPEDF